MKRKVFFSILLTTCLFASCGLIRKDDPNNPATEQYFIKHPWGSGEPEAWVWREMIKEGTNFVYEGLWGGLGANINKKASDNGAYWYPLAEIDGSATLSIGDGVKFTYNPAVETLSATKTSSNQNIAKVRIKCTEVWDKIAWGLIDDVTDEHVIEVDFSGRTGISDYQNIDVSAGHTYSLYWTDGNTTSIPWGIGSGVYCEHLEIGHKYTYTVGDTGQRTDDGTF